MIEPAALDARAQQARDWACAQLRLSAGGVEFVPASTDASFRRYFRLSTENDSCIVMDAPPEHENCQPFIQIAGLMSEAGMHVPEIIEKDLARGFLLLSDLGTQTYLQGIAEHNADGLFSAAIDTLILWQQATRKDVLPPYDSALLRRELALFPEWYVARHLRRELTSHETMNWNAVEEFLLQRALAQPGVYVHRDYMPRNLMISEPNPGVLDFQDALFGPISYDIASLFKDAFLSWPEARIRLWVRQYWEKAQRARLPVGRSFADFYSDFELMGVQRHLKVIGIFARINYRDGKPQYLKDVPRFIRYVRDVASRYRELSLLLRLFDDFGMLA